MRKLLWRFLAWRFNRHPGKNKLGSLRVNYCPFRRAVRIGIGRPHIGWPIGCPELAMKLSPDDARKLAIRILEVANETSVRNYSSFFSGEPWGVAQTERAIVELRRAIPPTLRSIGHRDNGGLEF